MTENDIWKVLGIAPTKDEDELKTTYRMKLLKVNPEDDPEGFIQLREAYDMAVAAASKADEEASEEERREPKDEVELHIDKAREIYLDISSRIDEDKWKEWLKAPVVLELDTTDRVREQFLAFCMGHFEFPINIWKLFNQTFNYVEEKQNLAEVFPIDYLNYIEFRTNTEGFVDFTLLMDRDEINQKAEDLGLDISIAGSDEIYEPEEFDAMVDMYLKELSYLPVRLDRYMAHKYAKYLGDGQERDLEEEDRLAGEEMASLKSAYEYLQTMEYFHPLELVAVLRVLYFEEKYEKAAEIAERIIDHQLVEKAGDYTYAVALFILAECRHKLGNLDEELMDSLYSKAEEILERYPDHIKSIQVKAEIEHFRGNYEKASEFFIDILDINSRDCEAIMLLRTSSDESVQDYKARLESDSITQKEKMELAWALFRTERTEETLELLKTFSPDEENFYGYNNLYGRCLFNSDNYRDAFPYLERWVDMIDDLFRKKESGETLTEKDEERLTRRSFAYFLYAACSSELKNYDQAVKYFEEAIRMVEEEKDLNELFYYQESYGRMLLENGSYPEAMKIWNSMIEKADHFVPAYINRQKTAYEMRDAQLVIDDYYNIIRDYPEYAQAYTFAAKVFEIYGQTDDMLSVYKRAEDAGVQSDELDSVKAKYYAKKNQFAESYEIYKRIVENIDKESSDITKTDDIVELYADMAVLLIHERDNEKRDEYLKEAETIVKKGQKLDKDNKRFFWILTDIYEWTGRNPEPTYKKMLKLYPTDSNIYFEYGEYFRRIRNIEKAEKYYQRALDVDPNHRSANNKLMNIYQDRYNDTENPEFYDIAVRFASSQLDNEADDYYYIERALLYLDGYNFTDAYKDACKAIEINNENVYAYNAKGIALYRMKKFREALECFDKAISLEDGDTQNPYINAAKSCESLKEYGRALEYIDMLKGKYEITGSILDIYGRLYGKLKKHEKAEKVFKEKEKMDRKLRESTDNPWYEKNIVMDIFRRIESMYLSGNDYYAVKIVTEEAMPYLKEKGYLVLRPTDHFSGEDARRAAEVIKELGDYYLYTERTYKKAVSCYRKSKALYACENIKKAERILALDSINPEDTTDNRDRLEDYARLYVNIAMAYRFARDKKKSREFANRGLKCIIKAYESIDRYISYKPMKVIRIRLIGMLKYFIGEKDEAIKLLSTMNSCDFCYFCRHGDCYDYYLAMARIMEMESRNTEALEFYRKAFDLSPEDMEVFKALQVLGKE